MKSLTHAVGLVAVALACASQTTTLHAITNGTTVTATDLLPGGSYGWLVRLENSNGTELCTGTVVGGEWVLSAYHCSVNADPTGGVTLAYVGSATTPTAITEAIRVGSSDAALFHLATPVHPAIVPARIAPSFITLDPSTDVQMAGWGLTTTGGTRLLLPSVGQGTVSALDFPYLSVAASPSTACAGDSGGPVFLHDSVGIVVYGVISSSDPACATDTGAVSNADFADVALGIVNQDLTAPVVLSGSVRTQVNTPVEIPIEFSDPDGFPMTLANITSFSFEHGSSQGCAANAPPTTCTFVPEQDFVGIARFRYTVSDGVNTATATWDIEVYQVPTVTITKMRVKEPTGNKPQLVLLDVQLAGPVTRPVVVEITPSGGTATAGADYRAAPLRMALSDKNRTGTYRLLVLPDAQSEFNETIRFSVTASDGVKVIVPDPVVTIVGDRSLPPVVHFEDFVTNFGSILILVAQVSDPDGPPLTMDNFGTAWTPQVTVDNTKVQVEGFLLETQGDRTYVGVGLSPIGGFTGSTPVTLTITDESGASGSDSRDATF